MSAAVPTRVERSAGGHGWTLLRGGEPYHIRGVGGTGRCARAAALGANSVRTWSTSDLGAALDAAHAAGLTVCAGLWVRHANLGPGWYEDAAHAAERDAKLEEFRTAVRTHRNHPALLCWAVGNEPNANGFSAHAPLWRYVNALAQMCKQEDPAHAVATVTTSPTEELAASLMQYAPDVEIWGVNVYGSLLSRLPAKMKALGWTRAYAVTEYGPYNWWQVKQTSWGAALEPSSTEKAATYRAAAEAFSADASCIGGFVFKWGFKFQVTVTWINLLNEYEPTLRAHGGVLSGGEETGGVEEVARVWTGAYPRHRAPLVDALTLAGGAAAASVRLPAGSTAVGRCEARHPQGAALTYTWLVLPECGKTGERARTEGQSWKSGAPPPVPGCILSQDGAGTVSMRVPEPGFYRLCLWVSDAHNKLGTANIPFESYAGGGAPASPPPQRSGAPATLPAAADGFVRDGKHAKACHVGESVLATKRPEQAGAGYGRTAYFRFDLPPALPPPSRALLRVYALGGDAGGRTVVNAHAVADASWDEAALCAAAAPPYAPTPAASVRVAGHACFVAWDVTAAVAAAAASGQRGVAFALVNAETSEKTSTWASRRAGADTEPQLALTF